MRAIITVLDSISHTTMPYNEFITYRDKSYKDEIQIVFLTGNEVVIPDNEISGTLEIHKVGKNPIRIRKELDKVIKRLETENHEWIIHLHSIRGSFSTLLSMICTNYRTHTVYTIHSTFTGFKVHNKILSLFNSIFSSRVVFVSDASYSAFPEIIKRIRYDKMRVIQNGVNLERIDAVINRKAINKYTDNSNSEIRCVYVARMVPLKNHTFLLDLIGLLDKNIKFIFIGKETSAIIDKAKELGVENRVDFTGLISREEVYSILLDSDLYISSSTLEGLPVAVLEGMYCGLPVILSDIPQHKEVVKGCIGAKLVGFELDQWAKAISDFSQLDASKRKDIGDRCRSYVANNFSLSRMHQSYTSLYNEILEYK